MFSLIKLPRLAALVILFFCSTEATRSQGVIATPRNPSPAASVSQTIGISTITVNYSRPSVRGREIWGKLVPYGYNVDPFGAHNAAPWRAGANENTVITFSHPATVQGHLVPAGSYGLFFTINPDNSTGEVVLSKDYKAWGSFWYDPKLDEMREKIALRDGSPTEMLTYSFDNITHNSTDLVLSWEKKQFPVKIEFAVDDIVMANAEEQLKNTVGFTWQGYASAAGYAMVNKVNTEEGLKWADQAVQMNRNFATLSVKAGLLAQTGKTSESDQLMKEAVTMANENELNTYGYQLLGQKDYDKAIEMLTLNTQRHPNSANVWDSLGEAYALKGDKKNAIQNFKKSLSLNPAPNVKANSEKYLQQLGE
ncbi:MAG TPA: DUF2911 domain-containing protein [Puia sp.]|nr:DUF2911 domain-containing protein [Puia sp.]